MQRRMYLSMLAELLPLPVFAVGLTGHRDVAANREGAKEIESSISKVLEALQRALGPAFLQEAAFFSPATPILHLITMGAEGAELLGMGAAEKCKIKVSTVFPFAWEDYRDDFSASAAAMAAEIIPRIHSALELPGRRAEGPRAYERANDVILSHIDLLVAVWDGGRAQGRAGTGDVVQAAVAKGIQIIVINPLSPNAPTLLAAAPIDDFELPTASDLARDPLPTDLIGFVHAMISPPPRRAQRQGLVDLIAETPRSLRWRLEYPLLLKTVGGQRLASQKSSPSARKDTGKDRTSRGSPDVLFRTLQRPAEDPRPQA